MIEIIAEAAQGFEGKVRQAQLLASGAVKAGADAVKFQLVYADELATPDYMYYDLFKSLELTNEEWQSVADIVHKAGKKLYFDVFGLESLAVAMKLKADGIKISTTEFYNETLVKAVLKVAPKICISVGGIPAEDIEAFIKREDLKSQADRITFMYGFQAEPTPLENNNLLRLRSLMERFQGFRFGFMDHSLGGDAEDAMMLPLMSLATGVSAIEKHITLDYALELEDYVSAITPTKMKDFVRLVRKFEPVLGSPEIKLTALEDEYRNKATKVVVARHDLAVGAVITLDDVVLKRVGDAFKAKKTYRVVREVVGRKVSSTVRRNEPVSEEILK